MYALGLIFTAAATVVLASPAPADFGFSKDLLRRALVSSDGICGIYNNSRTCTGSGFGGCCSQFGYCGSDDDHCGVGCQSGWGSCGVTAPTTTWGALGCYSDQSNARTLTTSMNVASNTIERCQAACVAAGFNYSGTEFGNQCFCGTTISNGGAQVDPSGCNKACSGNSTQICGGAGTLSVSIITPRWQKVGCYSDSTTARTLSVSYNIAGVTNDNCKATCEANGYKYAATEYGTQCFCGNSIQNGASAVGAGCNIACAGDSTTYCGGSNAMSLFTYM
ncbi:hypothetical protein JX265_013597 [Neoarthrinium moseri]|uniref:Uncharacterized protein n=1 Tax=Neoarthrinium moseri TaxID=1658444 RepID=A0A9P9W848_9PEZI|nr:uncharacterized protein JN550_013838 [Neoarthrinium moseri]KAI1839981.1 hypothetical protein JX266_013810 [Neoarthrinium moseri]KAI1849591.1 hypothetical protein JX265_013597 [Neoarthrinium moseri]KAI1856337.1 hypothetical protein JN550_013838 [Neoarthrinium moseri]